jgi:hypothetical protein
MKTGEFVRALGAINGECKEKIGRGLRGYTLIFSLSLNLQGPHTN